MCDPVTMMVAAGTLMTAYGQHSQGKYAEQVGKNNKIVADRLAADARARGDRDTMTHQLKVAQAKSKQRAAFGASGREITGSAADIIADTAMIGELDAMTIRSNAEREAYGYEVQGMNALAQGRLDKMAGTYGAGSTLLTGGAKVHDRWRTNKGL